MCSIAGLINKKGDDISDNLKEMLDLTEHRGPDGSGIAIGTSIKKAETVEDLDVENLKGNCGIGHSRLRITGTSGIQPLYGCGRRFVLAFNGEIWNYKELKEELMSEGHTFKTDSDGEVIVHLVEEKFQNSSSFASAVSEAFRELDGEYAFVVYDVINNIFVLVRDPIGVKQLYYDENSKYIGFCSEKKPLWNLDLKPKRVLPGEIVEIRLDKEIGGYNFEIDCENKLKVSKVEIYEESEALEKYRKALFDSVEKRILEQRKIGIIFSGGVDSVIVAQIAKQLGADITCYTSGLSDSSDVINAKKVAQKLNFNLRVNELTEEQINRELKDIIAAIESTNHLQVDVAIPIFLAVKLAKQDGIRVMLTGQGADELFAGYPWYPDVLAEYGPDKLNESLWNDIKNLYKDTLEREDKITMYHSIELRVPFLDPEVIKVAMSTSEKLKIKDEEVKYIHRRLAVDIDIPEFISWRPKEAAQHGSKVHDALKNVIEKRKVDVSFPKIKEEKFNGSGEELGSAYRYSHDVYENNESIQRVLDQIGSEIGVY
ncbi:MAG: asparagine synthase (glutamine-hydrolyzing) [Halobacteriota archaeon]|nr:asparagine synthase (glutamine-hydrolyzing) [Halobacteriota archaeon]